MHDRRQTITLAAALSGAKWPLPDRGCLVAGDRYLDWALRSYAAAGLSDEGIARRIADQVGPPPVHLSDGAWAVATHLAAAGATFNQIIDILVRLASEVPGWPVDPDELAYVARAAIAEFGA